MEHFLDNFPTTLQRPFSKEFILKAISIVLKENTFKFDGKNYKQVQGTAMGTKMAPTYATLVMGFLEKQLYQRIEERPKRNLLRTSNDSWTTVLYSCKNHEQKWKHCSTCSTTSTQKFNSQ